MERSLLRREVAPFLLMFVSLVAAAILGDWLLHTFNLVWIGRWLGIPGTLLILLSLLYSLRKRKLITAGSPRSYLGLHEALTWQGTMLVVIHAGVHFNAVLPWLAMIAMLVAFASGLTGQFLFERGRRHLAEKSDLYRQRGLSPREIEREVFWDATTLDAMAKWRKVHFPITLAVAILSLGHVVAILMFWNWS
ncbi:hypothetical protein [Magnetospirillum sp. 64-120]|uniref:hypothetical protein n=1 Tax=Magnetospirillum sp. 64-120 TaxID=1895778 RepID=UPI00092834FD|nr:hypothetical protein [Magnetospirillum sp. 64-120]OJX67181.1 MAG: hypothetical protein BGO92_01185 [Magnetospirillum sp. 64-120]